MIAKSSLLLDFRRGAQRVPPVCFGMLLGSNGNGWRASREDRPLDNSYFCECRFLGAGGDMKKPKNADAAPRDGIVTLSACLATYGR